VSFESSGMGDFVIIKSDGIPTYNFAVVVDDHEMQITHVIRAEEHLPNTPRQVLIYQALGLTPPEFAHVSLILGKDHSKMSKRHGATSINQYMELGYLPEALDNFLALLGWSGGDNQEIFSVDELIERFSIEGIIGHPAIFDMTKLSWMNGEYIRRTDLDRLTKLCIPFLAAENLVPEDPGPGELEYIKKVVSLLQERMKLLKDVVEGGEFFFINDIHYEDKAINKWLKKEDTNLILTAALQALHEVENWTLEEIEASVRKTVEELSLKSAGEMIHRLRASLTGRIVGPGLFEAMEVLGRERCLYRIRFVLQTYAGNPPGE
jgi:glutamyl-tRNA synthetase